MLRGKIRTCTTEGQILYWFRPALWPFLQLGLGLLNQPSINETGASGRTSKASPEQEAVPMWLIFMTQEACSPMWIYAHGDRFISFLEESLLCKQKPMDHLKK